MNEVMQRLHHDHRNLSRLYDMLEEQVTRYDGKSAEEPDLLLILDIMAYLNDYPKAYHHPLEEEAIAFMVEQGLGDAAVSDFIYHQHEELAQATKRLSQLFKTVALDQPVSIDTIRETLGSYLSQSRKHLQAEEDQLFPVMEKVLNETQWQAIAARIPEHKDPLFADDPDEAFAALKSRL